MTELVRLSKLMSQRGLSSRREADRLIEQGLVRVNGELVNTLGVKFPEDVEIELTQRAQAMQNELVTIMINKPVGYVSGQAEDDYVPAVRLIDNENHSDIDQTGLKLKGAHFKGLAPAGRLDIDSQGVLVLTQDGRIAKSLIGENSDIEKEYLVRVEGEISQEQIDKLTQIRRMCDEVGLFVTGLKRVRVGELRLGKLEEGEWRFVKPEEFRHRDAAPSGA